MYKAMLLILFIAFAGPLIGCGANAPKKVTPPDSSAILKSTLEEIAASGELGSGADNLESLLEELKATDSGKATTLLADYRELQTMKTPRTIKKKATNMLGKL